MALLGYYFAWRAAHALPVSVGARLQQSPGDHLGLALAANAFATWLSTLLTYAPSPSSGQGASLAIEDALVLAHCLRDTPCIEAALEAYID